MSVRTIFHCDLNNFFASVECLLHPEKLEGKIFAVAGNPHDAHGIILAKNTAARSYGVKTGETVWEAKAKCPELLFVPPSYGSYVCFSRLVYEIYRNYTDKIQSFGIDECWLDLTTTLPMNSALTFADHLRNEIRKKTGLTVSVGASFTKPFSKLGSDMKKPDATTLIEPERFKAKLYPLPVSELLYAGVKTTQKLARLNIRTIGDLAVADEALLTAYLGINGIKLQKMALGTDNDPVVSDPMGDSVKSVGHSTTVKQHIRDYSQAKQMVFMLSDMVGTRMRRYALRGSLAHLSCQNSFLQTVGKQMPLPFPTSSGYDIAAKCMEILREIWNPRYHHPIRSMSVSVSKLSGIEENCQISIFDPLLKKREKLDNTMDGLKNRFGQNIVNRGTLVNCPFMREGLTERSLEDDYLPFR